MRFRFVPREKKFFSQFRRGAANLVEGAELLKKMVDDYSDPAASLRAIIDAEHRGDEITYEIIHTLNTTFITPMDREDIHELASHIDDVLDHIEAAADLFVLHNIEEPTAAVQTQAEVLVRATKVINEAVGSLENFKGLEKYWQEVNAIEREGDKTYRRAVADLFAGNYKAMDVLKWKEIYDEIESAIDECENIGDTIEAVVLKNA